MPEFLTKPDNVTVPEGGDAKFQATFDGEPKPEVKWYNLGCLKVSLLTNHTVLIIKICPNFRVDFLEKFLALDDNNYIP